MAYRDIIISAYACNPCNESYPHGTCKAMRCRPFSCSGACKEWRSPTAQQTPSYIEQIFPDPETRPVVITVGHQAPGQPGTGDFANTIRKGGASWLHDAVFAAAAKDKVNFPKGTSDGRIALIGFSAGCGALDEILRNDDMASRIDTVIALDGLHGSWKGGSRGTVQRQTVEAAQRVDPASIAQWVRYAERAARGVGPTLIVTHSGVVMDYPSTYETAAALELATVAVPGVAESAPRTMIDPAGMRDPVAPLQDDRGGFWPSQHNAPYAVVKLRSLGLAHWFQRGRMIVAGYVPTHDADGYPGSSRPEGDQSAHIAHCQWVQDLVLREVLAPKWSKACTASSVGFEAKRAVIGQTVLTRGRLRLGGLEGLGGDEEVCVTDGVYSDLLGDEIDTYRRNRALMLYGGAAVGLYALAQWWKRSGR
jgi:hypothetical protein